MPTESDKGGIGLTIINLVEYFYADDSLVASTQLERLQREFDVLAGIFGRVSLRKNMKKTFVFKTYHAPGGISDAAYA